MLGAFEFNVKLVASITTLNSPKLAEVLETAPAKLIAASELSTRSDRLDKPLGNMEVKNGNTDCRTKKSVFQFSTANFAGQSWYNKLAQLVT